jgi:hypothetical protein
MTNAWEKGLEKDLLVSSEKGNFEALLSGRRRPVRGGAASYDA